MSTANTPRPGVCCPCVACRRQGRALPTEWFIDQVRTREYLARVERMRRAA